MRKTTFITMALMLPISAFAQDDPSGKTLAATMDVFVFPTEGQDASQQSQDEMTCYQFATSSTGDLQSADRQRQSVSGDRSFAQNYGAGGGLSSGSYDSSLARGSFDTGRHNELDRSYNARTSGYQNYNNRQSSFSGGRSAGGRQFRRRR